MGWRVTDKAGRVRDMKNKRKTGKSAKKKWVGGDIINDILQPTFSSIVGVTQDSVRGVINNLLTKGLLPNRIKHLLETNINDYYNLLPQNSSSKEEIAKLDKTRLKTLYNTSSIKRCFLNSHIESQYVQLFAQPDGYCLYYTLSVIIKHNPMNYKEIQIILIIIYHILLYKCDINDIKDIYNDLYPEDYGQFLYNLQATNPDNYELLFIQSHITLYKSQLTIRFYGILTNFINTKVDKKTEKTKLRAKLFSPDIKTVYDNEVTHNEQNYEKLIGYGTDKEIAILLDITKYKIVVEDHDIKTLNNNYGKHLLYNCTLFKDRPGNIDNPVSGNHYELLIKCTDAATNETIDHISTPYGDATRIIGTLFVLDIQLNEKTKNTQAITKCNTAKSTIPVAAAASSDITTAATHTVPVGTIPTPLLTSLDGIKNISYNHTTKINTYVFDDGTVVNTKESDKNPREYNCKISPSPNLIAQP